MSAPTRLAPTVCRFCRTSPAALRRAFASSSATTTTTDAAAAREEAAWPQRQPRGEYYDMLLRDPTPYTSTKVEASASSSPPPPSKATPASSSSSSSSPARTYDTIASRTAYSDSNSNITTAAERARVIFGSRLLGPAERADRAAGRHAQSTTVAGVRVPPRPDEPDNCCMSGCVNCVWDLYREEMEEWTLASAAAQKRLAASAASATTVPLGRGPGTGGSGLVGGGPGHGGSGAGVGTVLGGRTATTMDADGGGSETNWTGSDGNATIAKDLWTEDLFRNVQVGIREFMKQEKRLKEKHQREGTSGG